MIGGADWEDCEGVALDQAGNPVILIPATGSTLPTTAGAYQGALAGAKNAYVVKLSSDLTTRMFATYIGGTGAEAADSARLLMDAAGDIYVMTTTDSPSFPVTAGALQPTYGGGAHDAALMKLSADGTQLLYSSFIGGSGDDFARSIGLRP